MNKKGISFVVLIITILLLVILLGITTVGIKNAVQNSRKSAFASDLVSLEDAINTYYIQNGQLPILSEEESFIEYEYSNGTLIDKENSSNVITLTNGNDIETELTQNNDLSDTVYYKLDLAKINVERIKRGNGSSEDDIYVIASPSQNLYYLKGLKVDDDIYYSLVNLTDLVNIQNANTQAQDTTEIIQTVAGMSVKREKKVWTNTIDVTIDTYLESGENIYAIIPQAGTTIEKKFSTTTGQNIITIKNLKNSLGLTDAQIESFNSLQQTNKYIIIEKRKNTTKVGSIKVNLSNYETEIPEFPLKSDGTTYDFNIISDTEENVVSFRPIDNISGIKEVKYLELKEFDEERNIKSIYTDENGNNVTTFTPEYMLQNAKSANVSKTGYCEMKLSKDVESIYITLFDKAGNSISMQKNVQSDIYAGINVLNISTKLTIGYVIKSSSSISSAITSISTDGNTYTSEKTLTLTSKGSNIYTSSYEFNKQDNIYIRLVVKNSEGVTETRVKKINLSEKSYDMLNSAVPGIIYSENRYYTDKNGNKAIVPTGFKVSSKSDEQTIEDGLVIIDKFENEFVWVPVDGITVPYAKWTTKGIAYNNSDIADVPDELPSGVDENTQITKYGGFYIGRYEAGVPESQTQIDGMSILSDVEGTPVSKKGATVWKYISYTVANTNSKKLYDNDNVKSGLLTGTMWDTVCKWISNSGLSVTDSRSWGNHSDSIPPANVTGYGNLQKSGFSEYWKAKNIYDFAGNVWEWTNEARYDSRVYRGGRYFVSGEEYPAEYRSTSNSMNAYDLVGFRIALYIM